MQLWAGRPARCVFCEFRSLSRKCFIRPKPQRFHSSASKQRSRSTERAHTSEPPQSTQRGPNRRSEYNAKRTEQGAGLTRPGFILKRFGPDGMLKTQDRMRERGQHDTDPTAFVLGALPLLKTKLEQARAASDSSVSQYASLDPAQTHWSNFVDDIKLLLRQKKEGKDGKWPPAKTNLYRDLIKASSSASRVVDTRKALHFAFVDHVLQNSSDQLSPTLAKFADLRYPTEWYVAARAVQRDIHLHVGPTNSGKTYNALKRLEEAGNGFYAGPLRLLAHEVFSRFKSKGIACDLVTGDDVRRDDDSEVRLCSSTVEMVDVRKEVEVAVIDEIQMMASTERGWAWTRAFLGANAKEVHLCGENRVIPLVRELAASMGDTLHIHQYDRLNPLKAMSRSLRGNLSNLRKGDCVVSFTIVGIHALKKQIEKDTGRRVAIVYGSLPPETRARQAALFNDPDNDYDYLVASNAIGMGLNLAIKRIIFETTSKFNGRTREKISIPELKQIAGRAGRFRTAPDPNKHQPNPTDDRNLQYRATTNVGLVTCLDEADLPYIQEALKSEPEPIKAAGILPPTNFVEEYAARLPKGIPFEYVMKRLCEVSTLHPRFMLCDIRDQLNIIRSIEPVSDLTVAQRCLFGASPADYKDPVGKKVLESLARCVARGKDVTIVDLPEIPLEVLEMPASPDRVYLLALENLHKSLILFLWLSYRYINIFKDQEMAFHAKTLVEDKINTTLLEFSANPQLRQRLLAMKEAAAGKPSGLIDDGEKLPTESTTDDEPDTREILDAPVLPIDWSQGSEEAPITPEEREEPRSMAVGF